MTKLISRANSLRVYGEMLQNSDDCDISEIGDDLIEFAEQWEAELEKLQPEVE